MSVSEHESDSDSDSLQNEVEEGLCKASSIIHDSIAAVNDIIHGLRTLKKKLGRLELEDVPVRKEMYRSKFCVRVTVEEMGINEGNVLTYKTIISRLISWIDAEKMECEGIITPNRSLRRVFGIRSPVTFPELVGLLKKIIY
uniref:Uncharacterized protein n=1 Tax=viral metagenome TaxID=1070528 RepID=A0A6C0BK01_9ZZZZ